MGEPDWIAIGVAVVGILITTGGGLLSLVPDPDRPVRFIPVYIMALTLFCGGLALIMWCQTVPTMVDEYMNPKSDKEKAAVSFHLTSGESGYSK